MSDIVINLGYLEILEKTSSEFGTGAHIVICKKYIGKKVKIIVGKSKIFGNKIRIDFFESEILERKASRFGTGAHVIIPKEYADKKIKIIIEEDEKNKSGNRQNRK